MLFDRLRLPSRWSSHDPQTLLAELAALVDQGVIRSTMQHSFQPINAANPQRAHRVLESGRSIGKIMLSGGISTDGAGFTDERPSGR